MMRRLFTALLVCAASAGCAVEDDLEKTLWRLVYEENFDEALSDKVSPWVWDRGGDDSPWNAGPFDDDGEFFQVNGGETFRGQLGSFRIYRKSIPFGNDNWLTVELEARDRDKDGLPEGPPTFTKVTMPDGRTVGRINEPDHHGGVIIRNTRALPPRYRIEVTLVTLDFGGSRYDRWNRDGRVNDIYPEGAKTRHPWLWDHSDELSKPYEQWFSSRPLNGFYYLAIVDHSNPAPRNNIFLYTHRKLAMDSYNAPDERAEFQACDPANRRYYLSQDNAVHALFIRETDSQEPSARFNFMTETECGKVIGGEGGHIKVVSAVQLVPELLPKQTYRFAIERDATGYTMEMSGFFRFVGQKTYRYRREFVQDGHAIWHYNVTPDEYDGSQDKSWTLKGPFGEHTIDHTWPAGSAYPDYFLIGDPHTNFYEGSASIDDIRLYVPVD